MCIFFKYGCLRGGSVLLGGKGFARHWCSDTARWILWFLPALCLSSSRLRKTPSCKLTYSYVLPAELRKGPNDKSKAEQTRGRQTDCPFPLPIKLMKHLARWPAGLEEQAGSNGAGDRAHSPPHPRPQPPRRTRRQR